VVAATKCSHPVTLVPECVHLGNGDIFTGKPIEKPCGSRLADRCEYCSQVYAADARSVFNGGVESDPVQESHFTFLTLTAPGSEVFGKTHQRVTRTVGKDKAEKIIVLQCSCKRRHRQDDAAIGTPIDPSTYRYDLATDFNKSASRLLAVTLQRLSRRHGEKLRYARVAEFQKRGLLHFHILIRGEVSPTQIAAVVKGVRNEAGDWVVKPVQHGEWTWGEQVDVRVVSSDDKGKVGYYLRKLISYSTKGANSEASGPTDHRARMQAAALKSCNCEKFAPDCRQGKRADVRRNRYYPEASEKFCRRCQLAFNGWGFRGHILAFSRTWGMTFKVVRQRRIDFARQAFGEPQEYEIIGWSIVPAAMLSRQRT